MYAENADGKLVEQKPTKYSTRELVNKIFSSQELSGNPEGILQDIFYLAAVLAYVYHMGQKEIPVPFLFIKTDAELNVKVVIFSIITAKKAYNPFKN